MSTSCPHCQSPNAESATFCTSCGKALPKATGGPRVFDSQRDSATTAAGKKAQSEQLAKTVRKSFGALLFVAIVQTLAAIIMPLTLPAQPEGSSAAVVVGAILGVIAAVFYGLAFWARKSPLPASIVGLVLFVSLHALDAVVTPESIARGLIMKVIVIVVLVQAVQAGIKARELSKGTTVG